MKRLTILCTFLLGIGPIALSGNHRYQQQDQGHVVRHFHAGSDAPGPDYDDPNDGYIYVEDGRNCNGQSRGHWNHIHVGYCYDDCNCSGFYDDFDWDYYGEPYDPTFDWPSRNRQSWMYELDH